MQTDQMNMKALFVDNNPTWEQEFNNQFILTQDLLSQLSVGKLPENEEKTLHETIRRFGTKL
jgi:hypothetical protein